MEHLQEKIASNKFAQEAATPENPKWQNCISRLGKLAHKKYEIRSEFERDYNRILNCTAYSRLKHKTQVFFATNNDHVCTRMEHVNIVASIAKTIARALGLNVQLVEAMAFGHDLGHAPFGHHGETIIAEIMRQENFPNSFWHEKNSLRMVDHIETLPNARGEHENLSLTYAVRDGIVCHCGEVDENNLKPRQEFVDLEAMKKGQYMPYTYEGCVVKICDKLAYIGRDIEDASRYGFFTKRDYVQLKEIAQSFAKQKLHLKQINPTSLISELAIDLCMNSSIKDGLVFSPEKFELMNTVKSFILEKVCMNERLEPFRDYAGLVMRTIYNILKNYYDGRNTFKKMKRYQKIYPLLSADFRKWMVKYSDIDEEFRITHKFNNKIIYDIENFDDYKQAIIDFISSMSDKYIMRVYNDVITL